MKKVIYLCVILFVFLLAGCKSDLKDIELLDVEKEDSSNILKSEMQMYYHQPKVDDRYKRYEYYIIKDFDTYEELGLSYYSEDFFVHKSLVYISFVTPSPQEYQVKSAFLQGKLLTIEVEVKPFEYGIITMISRAFYKMEIASKQVNDVRLLRTDGW